MTATSHDHDRFPPYFGGRAPPISIDEPLAHAIRRITAAGGVDATLNAITEEARRLIGAHQAVASLTSDRDWVQAINAISLSDRYAAWRSYDAPTDGSGIYSLVCQTNEPMRLTQAELEAHPAWRGFGAEANRHPPMRGWLAVPLVGRDNRNIGLVQLSDKSDGGDFTEFDENILMQLAQVAAIAVENANLYELAQRAYAESVRQRDFNGALFQNLPGLAYLIDESLQFVDWNRNVEVVTGLPGREVAENRPSELFYPEDREFVEARMRQVFQQGAASAEARVHPRGGEPIPYHFEAQRISLDGRPYLLGFGTDISERRRHEAEIRRLSYRDPLTNLGNRALLLERLNQELARGRRHGAIGACLWLDLDDFKPVNDSLGHPIGDEVLKALAQRLSDDLRTEDTVARIGGDEFVILLPELGSGENAAALHASETADRLRRLVDDAFATAQITLHLSASIGVTVFPAGSDDDTADQVLRRADAGMYEAKRAGKGAIRFYRPEFQSAIHWRLTVEQELRRGFDAGDLALHYQPQINLASGRICGAEALVRWQHPERGFVSPVDFIPVAEQSGFVVPLGEWILRQALAQGTAWREEGRLGSEWQLAVNISPRHFALPEFAEVVESALADTGFPATMLTLEITETVLWEDPSVPEKMNALSRQGVRFAVDDFGTGYSSLRHLKQLPVHTIKVDKSFIHDMVWDAQSRTIVETLLLMAANLNLETVAEGIEEREQADLVRSWGCRSAQGFLYGKPTPPEEFPT